MRILETYLKGFNTHLLGASFLPLLPPPLPTLSPHSRHRNLYPLPNDGILNPRAASGPISADGGRRASGRSTGKGGGRGICILCAVSDGLLQEAQLCPCYHGCTAAELLPLPKLIREGFLSLEFDSLFLNALGKEASWWD